MERANGKPKGTRTTTPPERRMFEAEEEVARDTTPSGIARSVERGDRLAAFQKNAARLQHAMNNPLAALLAEEQLLATEDTLSDEHREAVERMIELTRRVIVLVRDLDGLRGSHLPR
ncbi:MAG TPA: histidine kinase dimerization/phospho-acceptor domain-containing protein [Gemmatimonadaceae bacterium]|nr:histidine kinase dimerization/phospho-acceptor domain-containing protein [Gemmatimonadaceae bacterium]